MNSWQEDDEQQMSDPNKIKSALNSCADRKKADFLPQFFQAYPGGYGEGDRFIGVTVPDQRRIARQYYRTISLKDLQFLIEDPFHECRLTALFMLILKYEKARSEAEKNSLVDFYLANLNHVNNWDLVDSSAYKILGPHLADKNKGLLFRLATSGQLWEQRVAIITTLYFIRNGDYNTTLELAELLLEHEHDLIHKAVGWMLREVGNRDFDREYNFLLLHYRAMPRVMLRYAIEKFDPFLRKKFLKGEL